MANNTHLIQNKKGGITFTSLGVSIIIIAFVFIAYFDFMENTALDNNYTSLTGDYLNARNNLSETQDAFYGDLKELQDTVNNATEASSIYQVAVNGFKGMGQLFKFPLTLFNYVTSMIEVTFGLTGGFMPIIVKTTLAMIILLLVTLLVLSLLSGGNSKI